MLFLLSIDPLLLGVPVNNTDRSMRDSSDVLDGVLVDQGRVLLATEDFGDSTPWVSTPETAKYHVPAVKPITVYEIA